MGTKLGRGANFRCIFSDAAIVPEYVRSHAKDGNIRVVQIAIVAEGKACREYVEPNNEHIKIPFSQEPKWKPDDEMNQSCKDLVSGRGYGFHHWWQLFTNRQLIALSTFSDLVQETSVQIEKDALAAGLTDDDVPLRDGGDGAKAYSEAICVYLAFILDKCADYWSSFCTWNTTAQGIRGTFGRQAIPMVWDFVEANPFSASTGNWAAMTKSVQRALEIVVPEGLATESHHDAQTVKYPKSMVFSTDPPYYDNISYADLSDYFFVWMRSTIRSVFPDLFEGMATPKADELIAASHRHDSSNEAEEFFMRGMTQAMSNMAESSSLDFPITIYYAFKQSEIDKEGVTSKGWATFLSAVIEAGYMIVGTWPMRTERVGRMNSYRSNALANSVVLVCRRRDPQAADITRSEFTRALKREMPAAITELLESSVPPADIRQSSVGPGMAVFSRHNSVLESDDRPMTVKKALQLINEELDIFRNNLIGEFDVETHFAVDWFRQYGYEKGDFGIAQVQCQALGISVETAMHAGIVEGKGGKVRLFRREEFPEDWNPLEDTHPTVWGNLQHLIHTLNYGELRAARMLRKIGTDKAGTLKTLTYHLHKIADADLADAQEAAAYNALIVLWAEIVGQAASLGDDETLQGTLI